MSTDIDKAIQEREKELADLKRQKQEQDAVGEAWRKHIKNDLVNGRLPTPHGIMGEIQELKKLIQELNKTVSNAFTPKTYGPTAHNPYKGEYTPTPRPLDQPFAQGDQIIYIPPHAKNDWTHPDCEKGFITGVVSPGIGSPNIPYSVYCRFWKKDRVGEELATKANSQLVSAANVRLLRYMDQAVIDKWLDDNYQGWIKPR